MYLHFYEAGFIAGFNPFSHLQPEVPWLLYCNNFNMDGDYTSYYDNIFNGWEIEENENETFYLVFVCENIRYYFTKQNKMSNKRMAGQRFVFYNDTITVPENENILQPLTQNNKHTIHHVMMIMKGEESKVRLTRNSNIDNSYVLK